MAFKQIIQGLNRIVGTQARVTVGTRQLIQVARNKVGIKAADELATILSKYPKAKATVAYKASERGFTVGAIQIKNGQEVIANGAMSVTGLNGKGAPLLKARLNLGHNGEIANARSWVDYGKAPKVEDMEFLASMRKGNINVNASLGRNGAGNFNIDTVKLAENMGIKKEAGELISFVNKKYNTLYKDVNKFFKGKDVDLKKTMQDFSTDKGNEFENLAENIAKAFEHKWLG